MNYYQFIKKYYPHCRTEKGINLLHKKIEENNLLFEIYDKYIDKSFIYLNNDKFVFLNRYILGINRILLYVPLNDKIGISSCMRFSIEQLLKFFYSIYFDKDINKINKTSYRSIKDDFKNIQSQIGDIYDYLEKLYTYYGKYSNNIHENQVVKEDTLYFLSDVLTQSNAKLYRSIIEDLDNVFKIFNCLIIEIFKIKYGFLSVSDRTKLKRNLSNKKYVFIYNQLNKNDNII